MVFKLEAPWCSFQKKVKALFSGDPDIAVGELYETDGDTDIAFDIVITNHEKYIAADRLLPGVKTFGNVTLGIVLYDEENAETDVLGLFETLFTGNPNVRDVVKKVDQAGGEWNYVVFKPDVVQFRDDNLADYQGNWSGLAQDIAPEVFAENSRGVYFCTGVKDTNAPLGEWP